MHNTSGAVRVSVQRGRAMSAKFLSTRVMVMIVLMAFLAAGKARDGNFMPTFFRYMIGLSALPTLADNMPCRFCRGVAAH